LNCFPAVLKIAYIVVPNPRNVNWLF